MQNGLFNVTEEQQSLVELIRDFMPKRSSRMGWNGKKKAIIHRRS